MRRTCGGDLRLAARPPGEATHGMESAKPVKSVSANEDSPPKCPFHAKTVALREAVSP